ncbi:MAG: DUF3105 domain-containing protein [Rhodospirillales bacterium]|nr:DUF3105 domain-containing protein [Rhodospirillales bacterium]
MGKRKTRTPKRPSSGGGLHWHSGVTDKRATLRLNLILAAIAAAVVIGGGIMWWNSIKTGREFATLAAAGAAILAKVENHSDLGRQHLRVGEPYLYPSRLPTSGPHDPTWVTAGFHDSFQSPTRLVHALEHGNVVIYYDRPGDAVLTHLRAWGGLFTGQWDGLVATPLAGLGPAVVLTAWNKSLRLDPFDAAAAAAFIEAFRGRGPENPARCTAPDQGADRPLRGVTKL